METFLIELFRNIARNIQKLREERNQTQAEFADYCGLSRVQILRAESGRGEVRLPTLAKIAYRNEVPFTELLTEQLFSIRFTPLENTSITNSPLKMIDSGNLTSEIADYDPLEEIGAAKNFESTEKSEVPNKPQDSNKSWSEIKKSPSQWSLKTEVIESRGFFEVDNQRNSVCFVVSIKGSIQLYSQFQNICVDEKKGCLIHGVGLTRINNFTATNAEVLILRKGYDIAGR